MTEEVNKIEKKTLYNYDEVEDMNELYENKTIDLAGKVVEGTVTQILVAKRGDLFSNFEYGDAEDEIYRIEVEIEIENVKMWVVEFVSKPKGEWVSPKSKLYKWFKQYGKYPHKNQKVQVKFDADERGKVVL